ncbi:PQQ-dependent sugar dehydrogenase ['Paenibacillus yunnanensis' Narsing Rao et al. 2020]|uniref:PQQ-dependent sugar dehydrogenase n=1 Tax=Paenibacillus tengchongensis TaxID=2608684 RepID=UPI00124D0A15|nr:PQQ-dependent sugar dehydrogenase [Paenibacillus tengchongensis]
MSRTGKGARLHVLRGALLLFLGGLTACSASPDQAGVEERLETNGPRLEGQPGAASPSALPSEAAQTAAPQPPAEVSGSSELPYTAEVLVTGLDVPWETAVTPDGRILLTERSGSLRVIENGRLRQTPLLTLMEPFASEGEGGLLGLALDPDFADNKYAYVYHSYRSEGEAVQNRVLRLKIGSSQAEIDKVLLDGIPGDRNHNGGRIRFGPDGYLYITTGERYEPELAQQQDSLGGKILRITRDGSIPQDNPLPGSPVYSWGHRNPQGLAWQPGTGVLFSSEHGQSAHDEINIIEPGANYGWPLIQGSESGDGMQPPLLHSGEDTWAPSGMAFITQGPWAGELLVANLAGEQVLRISPEEEGAEPEVQELFRGEWGRIRNVAEGPDGTLYLLTNNGDGRGEAGPEDDRLIALKPDWE